MGTIEWFVFGAIFITLFTTDLMTKRGALLRTLIYMSIAIAFGVFIWLERGANDALKYYTTYALEMTLSLDNIFVMSLIFGALQVPREYRERVLLLGILGAVVFRALFLLFGTTLVANFEWLLILAGIFLIWTSAKMLWPSKDGDDGDELDLDRNKVYQFLKKHLPMTDKFHGKKFIHNGHATPLLVALLMIEVADIIFALDSVPASLAVTHDLFLVYTSNMFAILGLRALYSVLEQMVTKFHHLETMIALILGFIGVKVLAAHWPWGEYHVNNMFSLSVVLGAIVAGVVWSLADPKDQATEVIK